MSMRQMLLACGAVAAIAGTVGATVLVVNSEAWAMFWEDMEMTEGDITAPVSLRTQSSQAAKAPASSADIDQSPAWLQYAREMDAAPVLCREALRSQLPAGLSAADVTPRRSVGGERFPSWRVSGRATVSDAYGSRWRYDYRCDLEGSTVTGLRLTDVYGHETILIAGSAP